MPGKRVLSVGQCFADHGSIARTFERHFQAEVIGNDSTADALDPLRRDPFDLVLVNRVLDADHSSGLELIRRIKADASLSSVPVMLVSNYEDAQQQAIRLGALLGFGKAELGQPAMLQRVRDAFGR